MKKVSSSSSISSSTISSSTRASPSSQKQIFFDSGPIISLIMSRLIWILPELKKNFGGHFYVTPAVKRELVERPITVHRFQFEALQVLKMINDGVLEVYDKVPRSRAARLLNLANHSFFLGPKSIDIIQSGEIESIAAAIETNSPLAIDERTLRLLVEDHKSLKLLLERRFSQTLNTNQDNLDLLAKELPPISIIRSIELVAIAYKLGLLNSYIPNIRGGREILVESALWATKFNGCAVTEQEIDEIEGELIK